MNIEQKKYAELLIAMATDFLMGNLTFGTLKSNLKIAIKNMEKLDEQ